MIDAAGKFAAAQSDPCNERWSADAIAAAAKGLQNHAARFPDLREKVEEAIRQAEAGTAPVEDPAK
ncbi:hypothetical protein [Haloferula sp. BvORR071]|uniref:hypothetical protein n=1 Tax=Haloferula sp. BvORR071 TaxID=1396141 RepID=UPI000554E996|nr:hypothetical protein [Haloferula sp. BvORR071]